MQLSLSTPAGELGDLPETTRFALLQLALDHDTYPQSLPAPGLSAPDLDVAERAGIVVLHSDSLRAEFVTPQVRASVVAQASASERRSAHRALAEAATDVERRAHHLAEAAIFPDESVAALVERAADAARDRGDVLAALDALIRASRLSDAPREQRRRAARAAYLSTEVLSDGSVTRDILRGLTIRDDEPGALHAAVAGAFIQLYSGGGSAASQLMGDAIRDGAHGWDAGNAELIDAFGAWLYFCWVTDSTEQWTRYLHYLNRLQPDAPEALRIISTALADSSQATEEARESARSILTDSSSGMALVMPAAAVLLFDLPETARSAAWHLVETGRQRGHTGTSLSALGLVTLDDFARGRWDDAQRLVDEGLDVLNNRHLNPVKGILCYVGALLAAATGQSQDARERISELDAISMKFDARSLGRFAHHARSLLASTESDWDAARSYALAISPVGIVSPASPAAKVAFELIEAAVHLGRVDEARRHHSAMIAAGLPSQSPQLAMLTQAAGAAVSDDSWQSNYERALAVPRAAEHPFEYARVLLAGGVRLRRERQPVKAKEFLHQAAVAFERLGAEPWMRRARAELRAAGEPVDASPSVYLTAQELSVAELAARGLSNKQIASRLFLSPRTVGGHLYRAFPKLGVVSRSGLRDALHLRLTD